MSPPVQRWRRSRLLRRIDETRDAPDDGPLVDGEFLRQLERLGLPSLDAITAGLAGEHAGRRRAQLREFAEYREYTPGDDLRLIDWNAYARLGEFYVKTSRAQESVALSLLIDCSRSMNWGVPNKLRYAKRLAAALGAVALLRADSIHLYALGDGEAVLRGRFFGRHGLGGLLSELEALPVLATTDLLGSVQAFRRPAEPPGITILISDLQVPPRQDDALDQLVPPGAILHIIDTAEALLPGDGGPVELEDCETGELLRLTPTKRLSQQYADLVAARARELTERSRGRDLRYVRVPTTTTPAEIVLETLRRQGVVQA